MTRVNTMGKDKKKKREKTTYVDDGRTISDMSGTTGGMRVPRSSKKKKKDDPQLTLGQTPWQTYRASVKMMFIPMLVVLGCICLLFLLMYLLMR